MTTLLEDLDALDCTDEERLLVLVMALRARAMAERARARRLLRGKTSGVGRLRVLGKAAFAAADAAHALDAAEACLRVLGRLSTAAMRAARGEKAA